MPCALVRAVQALSVTTMKALIWSWMLQPSATTPGLVEMDRPRLVLGEQLQLELFRRREGIDVVLGRIEVREGNVRADRNDGQERMELEVLLRDHEAAAGARGPRRGAGGIERDDGVAHRMSRRVDHAHGQAAPRQAATLRRRGPARKECLRNIASGLSRER